MRTKLMMVALVVMALLFVAVPGQAQHDDLGNPWDVVDVHPDHDDGSCDNLSGASDERDVDCIDRSPNSSREWLTDCFDNNPNANGTADMECSAYAVVYCPGLGTGQSPGKDYISFVCRAGAYAEVRSGILDGFGSFPQTKGVHCRNGSTGASVSCGCTTYSTTSSSFFGPRTPLEYPNQYLCGDV